MVPPLSHRQVICAERLLIVLPIQRTPLFNAVASGSPDLLAARDHLRRMAEIRVLTAKLFQQQKELLQKLEEQSTAKKVKENFLF